MYITKDPGPWQQYVKRDDNIGLPLQEVAKKYTMESNMYTQQMLMEIQMKQHQIEQDSSAVGASQPSPPPPTPSVTPSISVSPSVTPSISITPSETPSVTPSLTPTPSS
jgi:hypothetical protein